LETKTFKSEHFVPYLTHILPYNTFTMRKLLGKMTIPGQLEILKDEVDKTYVLFEAKVKERVNMQQKEEEAGGDCNSQPQSSQEDSSKVKFKKWDEDLKTLVWNILCLEWELAKLDNELQYVLWTP
jgi:hypothetical protein